MKLISLVLALALSLGDSAPSHGAERFTDVLGAPAVPSALAGQVLVNGLAPAGQRLMAAGQRGHILYSDDGGARWQQAKVPVSSDLVAVHFPSAHKGWAVGHDGVVLHSEDGGASWSRQLDGIQAARLIIAQGASATLVEEARAVLAHGPDKPFLDVFFQDEQRGFVVGAFNQIFATTDGGRNWTPWQARVDNPKGFHLNAIGQVGGRLYIVGEQGLVLRLSGDQSRFEALPTPYKGSFFGLTGHGEALVVYGLRGNALRSLDQGKSWAKIDTGLQSGLTAGCVTADGRLLLFGQGGQVLASADDGATFRKLAAIKPGATSAALATANGQLVLAGMRGLRVEALPAP
ncbi:MAG: YCF48-related protein [Pseudomonadota bacterium]